MRYRYIYVDGWFKSFLLLTTKCVQFGLKAIFDCLAQNIFVYKSPITKQTDSYIPNINNKTKTDTNKMSHGIVLLWIIWAGGCYIHLEKVLQVRTIQINQILKNSYFKIQNHTKNKSSILQNHCIDSSTSLKVLFIRI